MTVIDAHQHVWNLKQACYDWLGPELPELNRDFEFGELSPVLSGLGVEATILVQAADNDEDTDHMLATAGSNAEVVGVVGYVPLDDPTRAADRLAELQRSPVFAGVRNLIHDKTDPDWILRPDVGETLAMLAGAGIPLDYVTSGWEALRHIPVISERHPELRIVIDHLGKPPIKSASPDGWRTAILDASHNPRVFAKISGLYPSVGPMDSWSVDDLVPYVSDAVEIFGAHRLMYGGDWPISQLAGGYQRVWAAIAELARGMSIAESAQLFGGTAERFYELDPHRVEKAKGAK